VSHATIREVRYVVSYEEMSPPFKAYISFKYPNSAESSPLTAVTSRFTRGVSPQSLTNERALCKWARAGSLSSMRALLPLALRVTTDPRAHNTHTVITRILRYSVKKGQNALLAHLNDKRRVSSDLNSDFVSYWSYCRPEDAQDEVQSKWLSIHARYFRKLYQNICLLW